MTEEVKVENTVEPKTVQEETTINTPATQAEQSPDIKSESNKENWRKFREEREKDRKALQEAQKAAEQRKAEAEALKLAMESILSKDQPLPQQEQYSSQTEDDIIEKKVLQALEKQRHQIEQERLKKEEIELPRKLEQTYRDFNHVCKEEHLDYLEFHYPEVAAGFKYMPNGFDKWSSIYKAVKRFVPLDYKEDQNRIKENASKPKTSLPNMTDTKPTGAPWVLTEERKKANWERMQRDMKNLS
jgi:ribosomal protein L9